ASDTAYFGASANVCDAAPPPTPATSTRAGETAGDLLRGPRRLAIPDHGRGRAAGPAAAPRAARPRGRGHRRGNRAGHAPGRRGGGDADMSDTPNLAAALAAVQAQLPEIRKGETAVVPTKSGGKYTYSYANLADVSK